MQCARPAIVTAIGVVLCASRNPADSTRTSRAAQARRAAILGKGSASPRGAVFKTSKIFGVLSTEPRPASSTTIFGMRSPRILGVLYTERLQHCQPDATFKTPNIIRVLFTGLPFPESSPRILWKRNSKIIGVLST